MSIKNAAAIALALISSAALAGGQGDAACGAGACGKKEMSANKDASCGADAKKESHCGKKEGDTDAHCAKKDADCGAGACAKKDASCGNK